MSRSCASLVVFGRWQLTNRMVVSLRCGECRFRGSQQAVQDERLVLIECPPKESNFWVLGIENQCDLGLKRNEDCNM